MMLYNKVFRYVVAAITLLLTAISAIMFVNSTPVLFFVAFALPTFLLCDSFLPFAGLYAEDGISTLLFVYLTICCIAIVAIEILSSISLFRGKTTFIPSLILLHVINIVYAITMLARPDSTTYYNIIPLVELIGSLVLTILIVISLYGIVKSTIVNEKKLPIFAVGSYIKKMSKRRKVVSIVSGALIIVCAVILAIIPAVAT